MGISCSQMGENRANEMYQAAVQRETFRGLLRIRLNECKPNDHFALTWPCSFNVLIFMADFLPSEDGQNELCNYGFRLLSLPDDERRSQ